MAKKKRTTGKKENAKQQRTVSPKAKVSKKTKRVVTKTKQKDAAKKNKRTKVELSENFRVYDRWVKSGWSPVLCSRKAFETYGEEISWESFSNYREKLPLQQIFQPGFLNRKLGEVDLIFDASTEIAKLVAIQQERLIREIDREEANEEKNPEVDRLMASISELLNNYASLTEKLVQPGINIQNNLFQGQALNQVENLSNVSMDYDQLIQRIQSIREKATSGGH